MPNPLEFGIIIVDDDGRMQRFLEKPTWGQVFSDTVNTGIYVMEPEVLAEVAAGESVDWSSDVFPRLLERGAPLHGYIASGYWEDVGTHESYLKAQADVLAGRVDAEIDGFEVSPGIWVADGAEVDPEAVLKGPLCIGDYAKIEAGAELREFTVIGSNVVVKEGAFLHRAVVHNNVYIGPSANLRGCVIGKNTDVMGSVRIEEGAVVGDECVIEAEAYLSSGVKVYPFKTIEAGAVVNTSVIWESRGPAHAVRAARRVRARQRGDNAGTVRAPGQCLRHYAQEGRERHHVKGRLPCRPRAQAGRARRAHRERDQRAGPGGAAAAGGAVRDVEERVRRRDRTADHAGRSAGDRPHILRRARRRPVPGGAAEAGTGVLTAGIPPRLPWRDRRTDLPAQGDGDLHARTGALRRHDRRAGKPG